MHFMADSWRPSAWYVSLDDLRDVFMGYFRGGGNWAEVWAFNTDLTVFRDKQKFKHLYLETFFGCLDQHVSCVKLILSVETFARFREYLRDDNAVRENIESLGANSARIFIRSQTAEETELLAKKDATVG